MADIGMRVLMPWKKREPSYNQIWERSYLENKDLIISIIWWAFGGARYTIFGPKGIRTVVRGTADTLESAKSEVDQILIKKKYKLLGERESLLL